MEKFKENPYNFNNFLIERNDIVNIMKSLNINDFNINNLSLYQKAFIHKSYCERKDYEEYECPDNCLPLQKESYETIEFLGDSILGSVICSYIYKRFNLIHGQTEGFLTRLKIRLVCGDYLTTLSNHLEFNKYIILSKHVEEKCSGRSSQSILEDIFESFIGALYLDKGYDITELFLLKIIDKFVDFTDILLNDTNYKDQIIRYLKKSFNEHPKYVHEKINDKYYCNIVFKDDVICRGEGCSKKKSEQDVSKKALIYYNVLT
jgi:ribonuclease III